MSNPFDQLAEAEVPQPPKGLAREVHQRLNGRLLMAHSAELVLQAIPFALGHFLQAIGGSSTSIITGESQTPESKNRRESVGDDGEEK